MPYRKSKARQEFETKSDELLSLSVQISYKKVTLSYQHKNLIFQSSVVLLCSSLEEYLRVFVEDLFFNYKTNAATLSQIPKNPKTFSLFIKQRNIFESFIFNRDESKVLEKLDVSNSSMYSIIDGSTTLTNHIDSKLLTNDKKYPSPKNLNILFNRLGLKGVFNQINALGKKDYEILLRSFLDIRETIAHQQSITLTINDIKRNFGNISDLVNKLDRVLYRHICNQSGLSFWK